MAPAPSDPRDDPRDDPRADPPIEVIWQAATGDPGDPTRCDEAIVFKPAGLSSERGPGDLGDSLARRAARAFGWNACLLPHRLDRPTRGLMAVTGSKQAAARCSEEIRSGAWTKWYIARIDSNGSERLRGPHRAYLKRVGRLAQSVRSGGDPSRLEVLDVDAAIDDPSTAFALIRLDTGRYHQIRVMLAALGFPLVGDSDYGGRGRIGVRTQEGPAIDLEAIALRIERGEDTIIHRVKDHPSRRGVSARIESALDGLLSAR